MDYCEHQALEFSEVFVPYGQLHVANKSRIQNLDQEFNASSSLDVLQGAISKYRA